MKMILCDRCGKPHDIMYKVDIRRNVEDGSPGYNAFELFADSMIRTIDLCKPCTRKFLDDVEELK